MWEGCAHEGCSPTLVATDGKSNTRIPQPCEGRAALGRGRRRGAMGLMGTLLSSPARLSGAGRGSRGRRSGTRARACPPQRKKRRSRAKK